MKTLSRDILDLLIRRRIADNKPTNIDQFYLCVYQAVCGTSNWNPDVPPIHADAKMNCSVTLVHWQIGKLDNERASKYFWEYYDYWRNYLEIAQLYLNLDQLPPQLRVNLH